MSRYTLNVFKEMYYHELTIKEALHSRVAVPLAALSIIATLIVYYMNESRSLPELSISNLLLTLYYGVMLIITCLVLYASALLFKVIYGQKYGHIPPPKDIEDYVKRLEQVYESSPEKDKKVASEFENFMNDIYRDATQDNIKNNHSKIKNIRRANLCIILALILCVINAVPLYVLNKMAVVIK